MKTRNKILLINLGIFLLYSGMLFAQMNWSDNSHSALTFLIGTAVLLSIQTIINLIFSLVYFNRKEKEIAKIYLLTTFLVPLIGASSCFGFATTL